MATFSFTILSKTAKTINPDLQRSLVNSTDVNLLSYTSYDIYETKNDIKIKGSDIKTITDVSSNTLNSVPNLSKTTFNMFGIDNLSYDTITYENKKTKDYNFNI